MKTAAMMAAFLFAAAGVWAGQPWRPAERWRGFNLLGMFYDHGQAPGFEERDFREIHELGFNFVRLPMDYRFWIKDKAWDVIDEERVKPIDQAIAWGKRYRVHTQLCFHRAPGYTVAKPAEARDLFTDPEAQRVCALHWAFFARRYKGIPNEELSFDLFNEPGDVAPEKYEKVARLLIETIHREDPGRFIIADGLKWGGRPLEGLFGERALVGQAMRGYAPMAVSHYLASWVGTPSAEPYWPPAQAVSPLYSPGKAPLDVPFVIGNAPAGDWSLQPGKVSNRARFCVEADGRRVLDRTLVAKPGPGWEGVVFSKTWNIYQGRCLEPMAFTLAKPAKRLSIRIAEGDWAEVEKLTVASPAGKAVLPFSQDWGKTNGIFRFAGWTASPAFCRKGGDEDGAAYLTREMLDPWKPARDAGVFTMVGEFGAYNKTPHAVVLAWMEDNLKLWKRENLGWALWNYDGPFGIIGSARPDVAYEDFHGRKLDRKMLELLQRY